LTEFKKSRGPFSLIFGQFIMDVPGEKQIDGTNDTNGESLRSVPTAVKEQRGVDDEAQYDEYWPSMTTTTTQHELHTLDFGSHGLLKYQSMSIQAMTPLDMTYDQQEDEFYDGTGHLLWLAAVTLAHLLAHRVECLQPYLPNMEKDEESKICELGCGTGGGGMSLLLFHCLQAKCTVASSPNVHVVFTDNDVESLELCRSNCELNGIDPQLYSQELLWWGLDHLPKADMKDSIFQRHSFDTILATDVVYDLKMIRPLLETAYGLLKQDGHSYFILSHVPRFCLPIGQDNGNTKSNRQTRHSGTTVQDTGAFEALEEHVVVQANLLGLDLIQTIRPANELVDHLPLNSLGNDGNPDAVQRLTIQTLAEAHAIIFIFSSKLHINE
jgi:2-polyprenyl-3-methyl-5-hydroxy-6-metoxy-1,4-benzoquinol methylase